MRTQKTENRKQKIDFRPCRNVLLVILIFILSGCGDNIIKPLLVCPGKGNVTESLAALQSHSENMIPLFTNKGNFSIEYFNEDQMRKQHFSITALIIKPPSEIYIQARTGIIDKALILGSNEQEFWLEAKPDQISSYWWGLWSQQNEDAGIIINPGTLLEALGIAEIDTNANWSLSNEGAFDVLTQTRQNSITKKLYIYCCDDYRVRKIEYFNRQGNPYAIVNLDNYTEISPGFSLPFSIVINSISEIPEESFVLDLTFKSVKPATEKHQDFSIVRREPMGFDHIYQVINGQWLEQ